MRDEMDSFHLIQICTWHVSVLCYANNAVVLSSSRVSGDPDFAQQETRVGRVVLQRGGKIVRNSFPPKIYSTNLFLPTIDAEAEEYNHREVFIGLNCVCFEIALVYCLYLEAAL